MLVKKLVQDLTETKFYKCDGLDILGLSHDHKEAKRGDAFFCLKGSEVDGSKFAENAIEKGVACLVVEQKIPMDFPQIIVKDCRKAMSIMAANFYDNCHKKMNIISLVGTNGKTTTTFLIKSILEESGKKVAVIGTNGAVIDNKYLDIDLTTPDPIVLHYLLFQAYNLKIDYVVMEVSAHAIALSKVYGINFRVGIFTNITPEHLDFFKDFEDYSNTKIDFFDAQNMEECVANSDCPFGQIIAHHCGIPCVTYGLDNPANVFAVDVKSDMDGISFFANLMDDVFAVSTPLIGDVNVYNILTAMSGCRLLGVETEFIQKGLKKVKKIEGRFNRIKLDDNKLVVIDFAHTPDGIEKALSFVRKNVDGKVITIFGCVGYSDLEKRKEMALAVEKYSDYVIVSSDNPGKSRYIDIAPTIEEGFSEGFKDYSLIEDRKEAIRFGLKRMEAGDTLVLLGKGAETSQNIAGVKVPYNDEQSVMEALSEIREERMERKS